MPRGGEIQHGTPEAEGAGVISGAAGGGFCGVLSASVSVSESESPRKPAIVDVLASFSDGIGGSGVGISTDGGPVAAGASPAEDEEGFVLFLFFCRFGSGSAGDAGFLAAWRLARPNSGRPLTPILRMNSTSIGSRSSSSINSGHLYFMMPLVIIVVWQPSRENLTCHRTWRLPC